VRPPKRAAAAASALILTARMTPDLPACGTARPAGGRSVHRRGRSGCNPAASGPGHACALTMLAVIAAMLEPTERRLARRGAALSTILWMLFVHDPSMADWGRWQGAATPHPDLDARGRAEQIYLLVGCR
jgi:hypothetical protein